MKQDAEEFLFACTLLNRLLIPVLFSLSEDEPEEVQAYLVVLKDIINSTDKDRGEIKPSWKEIFLSMADHLQTTEEIIHFCQSKGWMHNDRNKLLTVAGYEPATYLRRRVQNLKREFAEYKKEGTPAQKRYSHLPVYRQMVQKREALRLKDIERSERGKGPKDKTYYLDLDKKPKLRIFTAQHLSGSSMTVPKKSLRGMLSRPANTSSLLSKSSESESIQTRESDKPQGRQENVSSSSNPSPATHSIPVHPQRAPASNIAAPHLYGPTYGASQVVPGEMGPMYGRDQDFSTARSHRDDLHGKAVYVEKGHIYSQDGRGHWFTQNTKKGYVSPSERVFRYENDNSSFPKAPLFPKSHSTNPAWGPGGNDHYPCSRVRTGSSDKMRATPSSAAWQSDSRKERSSTTQQKPTIILDGMPDLPLPKPHYGIDWAKLRPELSSSVSQASMAVETLDDYRTPPADYYEQVQDAISDNSIRKCRSQPPVYIDERSYQDEFVSERLSAGQIQRLSTTGDQEAYRGGRRSDQSDRDSTSDRGYSFGGGKPLSKVSEPVKYHHPEEQVADDDGSSILAWGDTSTDDEGDSSLEKVKPAVFGNESSRRQKAERWSGTMSAWNMGNESEDSSLIEAEAAKRKAAEAMKSAPNPVQEFPQSFERNRLSDIQECSREFSTLTPESPESAKSTGKQPDSPKSLASAVVAPSAAVETPELAFQGYASSLATVEFATTPEPCPDRLLQAPAPIFDDTQLKVDSRPQTPINQVISADPVSSIVPDALESQLNTAGPVVASVAKPLNLPPTLTRTVALTQNMIASFRESEDADTETRRPETPKTPARFQPPEIPLLSLRLLRSLNGRPPSQIDNSDPSALR